MCRKILLSAVFLVLATAADVRAQSRGLVSQVDANRFSLQRAWFTRAQVDSSRGRIAHVTQHVSSTRAYTVHEVSYEGGELRFSERDLDRFGEPLGQEGAKKAADQKVEELKRLNLNPQVTTQTIPEISLYVMTDMGLVQAIDGESGRTRWATPVGNPNHPSEAPGASDDYVAVVVGTDIYVLDQANGSIVWRRRARGAPGAGPAVTDYAVFVPMVNGAIESYQLADYRQPPWVFKSHGRAMVQPTFTGLNVAWPTDRGHLYVAEGNRNNILFRLETNNAIVAPATPLTPSRILAVSIDGYLYCVHETSGAVQWRFSTGEPISSSPIVINDAIYLVTDDGSLFRLAADTGQQQWWMSGVRGFLSASEQRLYCSSRTGRLLIIDAASGARIGSLSTEVPDFRLVNKMTDRIFLGTRSGVIQCLHEVRQEWPLIHAGVLETAAPEPPPTRPATPAREPEETPVDPFGAEADPFGTGGADPFGTGGATEEPPADPFGTGSSPASGDDPFAEPF